MSRVQLAGVGSLRPNTIVAGWPSHATPESAKSVVSLIQLSRAYNKACMFLKAKHDNFPSEDDKLTGTIDLWWILQEVLWPCAWEELVKRYHPLPRTIT